MRGFGMVFLAVILIVLIVGVPVFFSCTPAGVSVWNTWFHKVQEADDNTNYETRKRVEDTCRAMITSYNSDKLVYDQYKDSDNTEERSWAAQAKMRANKTASSYNNYVLKNNYVWKNNVPADIYTTLPYIE